MRPGIRSAFIAALACASLLTITDAVAAKTTHKAAGKTGTAHAKAGKSEGKSAKRSGKKETTANSEHGDKKKSKSHKDTASVPIPAGRPGASSSSIPSTPDGAPAPEAQPPTPELSDPTAAAAKRAIESVHSGGIGNATQIEGSITEDAARKLVEWIILRSENSGVGSSRYLAFIAANPNWPGLANFRRRAEGLLWAENPKPAQVLRLFADSPPQSARGRLLLARALIAKGDTEGAKAQVRQAWRNDPMSGDLEKQVLDSFSALLSRTDHKARMEVRLFAGDHEAAMRAAHRLGEGQVAIAKARIALAGKKNTGSKQLEAVPDEARQDPGYIYALARALRHDNKIAKAAQVMLAAPTDIDQIGDSEGWWLERRDLARKLLDIGDPMSAYRAVADAAEPTYENSEVERHFMAGWIALRYLDDPATAKTHFARIQKVSIHPTSLARSHYWLGRTAEALGRADQARAEYESAARSSAAYYGQLARARLGLGVPTAWRGKRDANAPAQFPELVRALEILYELNERSLAISFLTGAGRTLDDVGTLGALGELAERYRDPRGMLQLGKAAVARGLPLEYYAFPTVGVPRYSAIGPGIDTAMLFAIIRQESAFDPNDFSAAHAMGLMQVTPSAGRDTCKRFGCSFDVKRLKSDMAYNLQLGAAELGSDVQDYRGNLILAFAAYNAGRGRVQEWVGRFGDPRDPKVDPLDWVERIPIMETRNYVQRVMENLQVYRVRFLEHAQLTIDTDVRGHARRSDTARQ
ncbi:MAG TPA: transglycosylase SLT domain-containing protein [Xanthobacteraceae bacterium]